MKHRASPQGRFAFTGWFAGGGGPFSGSACFFQRKDKPSWNLSTKTYSTDCCRARLPERKPRQLSILVLSGRLRSLRGGVPVGAPPETSIPRRIRDDEGRATGPPFFLTNR